ncbi:unnamed protein product [Cladocopium goreaui]|uniref:Uncharacterized protein n=1 Tax=Cladocopium goreaui TaxID=2562237 RepID=A0A9P1BSD4_9DINO|nr:unnamed protein product [Cladocopium goreaui]
MFDPVVNRQFNGAAPSISDGSGVVEMVVVSLVNRTLSPMCAAGDPDSGSNDTSHRRPPETIAKTLALAAQERSVDTTARVRKQDDITVVAAWVPTKCQPQWRWDWDHGTMGPDLEFRGTERSDPDDLDLDEIVENMLLAEKAEEERLRLEEEEKLRKEEEESLRLEEEKLRKEEEERLRIEEEETLRKEEEEMPLMDLQEEDFDAGDKSPTTSNVSCEYGFAEGEANEEDAEGMNKYRNRNNKARGGHIHAKKSSRDFERKNKTEVSSATRRQEFRPMSNCRPVGQNAAARPQ